jgi:hypothetical protein
MYKIILFASLLTTVLSNSSQRESNYDSIPTHFNNKAGDNFDTVLKYIGIIYLAIIIITSFCLFFTICLAMLCCSTNQQRQDVDVDLDDESDKLSDTDSIDQLEYDIMLGNV